MKNRQSIIFPFLGILVFLFSSCMTIKQYGQNTDSFEVLYSGEIKKFKKSGTYTESDIVVNDRDKSGGVFILFSDLPVANRKMKGTISLYDFEYAIKMSYRQEYEGDRPYSNRISKVTNVTIEGLPAMYQFSKFDIERRFSFKEKNIITVYENDMPVVFTNFSIGENDFSVLVTVMNVLPSSDDNISSFTELIPLKEQIFQIVDKNGTVYAEFSYDSYKIFSVPDSKIDEKLLWPCIAVFSTLRNIVLNIN